SASAAGSTDGLPHTRPHRSGIRAFTSKPPAVGEHSRSFYLASSSNARTVAANNLPQPLSTTETNRRKAGEADALSTAVHPGRHLSRQARLRRLAATLLPPRAARPRHQHGQRRHHHRHDRALRGGGAGVAGLRVLLQLGPPLPPPRPPPPL